VKKIIILSLCLSFLISCAQTQNNQHHNYGLDKTEIECILGVYLEPDVDGDYALQAYSWGRQRGLVGWGVIIDYEPDLAILAGDKYANYMILFDAGLFFLVKEIRKITEGKYNFDLVLLVNVPLYKPKNAGMVTVTLLDNTHMLIDTSSSLISSWKYPKMLWKCAGPLIKESITFPDLPDAEL
jgi:hypothetical protein